MKLSLCNVKWMNAFIHTFLETAPVANNDREVIILIRIMPTVLLLPAQMALFPSALDDLLYILKAFVYFTASYSISSDTS